MRIKSVFYLTYQIVLSFLASLACIDEVKHYVDLRLLEYFLLGFSTILLTFLIRIIVSRICCEQILQNKVKLIFIIIFIILSFITTLFVKDIKSLIYQKELNIQISVKPQDLLQYGKEIWLERIIVDGIEIKLYEINNSQWHLIERKLTNMNEPYPLKFMLKAKNTVEFYLVSFPYGGVMNIDVGSINTEVNLKSDLFISKHLLFNIHNMINFNGVILLLGWLILLSIINIIFVDFLYN